MVEVFKTDVKAQAHAEMLVKQIQETFNCCANFDLQDCDKILRVKFVTEKIQPFCLIDLLKEFGFHAEILPDDIPTPNYTLVTSSTY